MGYYKRKRIAGAAGYFKPLYSSVELSVQQYHLSLYVEYVEWSRLTESLSSFNSRKIKKKILWYNIYEPVRTNTGYIAGGRWKWCSCNDMILEFTSAWHNNTTTLEARRPNPQHIIFYIFYILLATRNDQTERANAKKRRGKQNCQKNKKQKPTKNKKSIIIITYLCMYYCCCTS